MISISVFEFKAIQPCIAVAATVLPRFCCGSAAVLLRFCCGSAAADASEFHAYNTRLGFADDPEATLPGRTLTGKYADVVVRLPAGRFVFSREHSYLPYWEVGASQWLAPEIVARSGDGPPARLDNINRCWMRMTARQTSPFRRFRSLQAGLPG